MKANRVLTFLLAALASCTTALAAGEVVAKPRVEVVPGVIIDHSPASSGLYIGSPSLAVLTNGDYVASHDFFGPKSAEHKSARSVVFRSSDRGRTWKKVSEVQGAFWSSLFVHRGALYLLGPDRHHGNILIRRSTDGGGTWTSPDSAATGLLRDNGEYHCAPMPVIEHNGRLWRAFEWRNPPIAWGINYRAGMLSAPADSDLLNSASWISTEFLSSSRLWNGGDMGAWLEGNAVVTPGGEMVDVLRVQTLSPEEKAAIVRISADGKTASFDPTKGFVKFPGGAKKFTIRFDASSKLYWALASIVHERHRANNPGGIRNTLALTCSPDLTNWTVRCILLYHPEVKKHGFQYVDWLFEGDDIIAACRTAFDDAEGGAHNNHDANFLTFHRFANFRRLTMADSVPMPRHPELREEAGDLIISGQGWSLRKLADGEQAFANRDYVWKRVPEPFLDWRFTQTSGGEPAEIKVQSKSDGLLHFAAVRSRSKLDLTGWTEVPGTVFSYSDKGSTEMCIFSRAVKAGETISIPQGNWAGGLLLVPAK